MEKLHSPKCCVAVAILIFGCNIINSKMKKLQSPKFCVAIAILLFGYITKMKKY